MSQSSVVANLSSEESERLIVKEKLKIGRKKGKNYLLDSTYDTHGESELIIKRERVWSYLKKNKRRKAQLKVEQRLQLLP